MCVLKQLLRGSSAPSPSSLSTLFSNADLRKHRSARVPLCGVWVCVGVLGCGSVGVWDGVRWLCAGPCMGFHVYNTTEGPSAPEGQSLLLCWRETCEWAGVQLVQRRG